MVCRGGGIWTSDNGLSVWRQISDGSIYPKVEGRFEDPVLWRDSVQYNLIVNDWLGRIAYYLRSAGTDHPCHRSDNEEDAVCDDVRPVHGSAHTRRRIVWLCREVL